MSQHLREVGKKTAAQGVAPYNIEGFIRIGVSETLEFPRRDAIQVEGMDPVKHVLHQIGEYRPLKKPLESHAFQHQRRLPPKNYSYKGKSDDRIFQVAPRLKVRPDLSLIHSFGSMLLQKPILAVHYINELYRVVIKTTAYTKKS